LSNPQPEPRIAVLLPCYNEEAAIAATVKGFKRALPTATVYVYDNNSSDRTREIAKKAGAIVRSERQQGKGHVVRRMFADVDADVYVIADGDLTYDPKAAPAMVDMLIVEQLDMVVGTRRHEEKEAFRGGHVIGNKLFTGLLAGLFGRSFTDIFTGYRVFSRRFVKSFPVLSSGFEIETEISVHALELRMPVGEVETAYAARPEGSDPEDDRNALPNRAAGPVLRLDRRPVAAGRDPAFDSAGHHLPPHRARSAASDGDPGHRYDDCRRSLLLCRPDPRHRDTRAQGGPAAGLSRAIKFSRAVTLMHHPTGIVSVR
jgi:hypothetical protein